MSAEKEVRLRLASRSSRFAREAGIEIVRRTALIGSEYELRGMTSQPTMRGSALPPAVLRSVLGCRKWQQRTGADPSMLICPDESRGDSVTPRSGAGGFPREAHTARPFRRRPEPALDLLAAAGQRRRRGSTETGRAARGRPRPAPARLRLPRSPRDAWAPGCFRARQRGPRPPALPRRSNQPPGAWRTPYGRESRGEWFQRGAALRERLATSQRRDGRAGGGRRAGLRVAGGAPPSVPRNPTRRVRRSAERTETLKKRLGARTKIQGKACTRGALRLLYGITLRRPDVSALIPSPRIVRSLPAILSPAEGPLPVQVS